MKLDGEEGESVGERGGWNMSQQRNIKGIKPGVTWVETTKLSRK